MAATSTIQYIAIMVIGILYQLITTTAVGITYEFYGSDSNFECSDADSDDICILHCDPNTPGSSQFNCGSARDCYFYCEDKQCLRAGILNATSSQNLYAYTSVELCYENANVYTAQRENYFNINEFDQREHKKIIINGGDSESIFINCTSTGPESCRQMIINAQNVTDLEIVGGAGTIMEDTIIHCPQNSDYNGPNEAPCFLDFSDGIIHKGNFYTLNGIPQDIMIYGELTSTVTIWCDAGLIFSVNVGNSFQNTDCWITSTPTTYPTVIPTTNPSFNPTFNPSSDPIISTIEPTTFPVTNPSVIISLHPSSSSTSYPLSNSNTTSSSNTTNHVADNEGHVVIQSTQIKFESTYNESDDIIIHFWDGVNAKSIIVVVLVMVICILSLLFYFRNRKKLNKETKEAYSDYDEYNLPKLDTAAANSLSTSIKKVALQLSHRHDPQLRDGDFMNMNILSQVHSDPAVEAKHETKGYDACDSSALSLSNGGYGPKHRKQKTNMAMEGVDDNVDNEDHVTDDDKTTNKNALSALDIVLPAHCLTPDKENNSGDEDVDGIESAIEGLYHGQDDKGHLETNYTAPI